MAIIKQVRAREVLDSRGNPTVMAEVLLDNGIITSGYAPSGAAKGDSEALEMRDGDEERYRGKGVLKAVEGVNTVVNGALAGKDAANLAALDKIIIDLDGTPNKSRLGSNATIATSFALAKASAKANNLDLFIYLSQLLGNPASEIKLPIPFLNILNGGKHAMGSTDMQEFMIVPVAFNSFSEALRAGVEVFFSLAKILTDRNYQPLVGDEGGYAPALYSNEQAMELMTLAIKAAGYNPGEDIFLALDPAASRFFENDYYVLHRENRELTSHELVDYYSLWAEKYPIIYIEDPFDQSDWLGWQDLTQRIGHKVEIIGDEIYSTNPVLLQKGIESKASTGILIKPNQIGTVTETIETIKKAEQSGFKVVVSHRSGETEDTFIADLAVATGCGALKAGAPSRAERTTKYNRILEIESLYKGQTSYAKWE
ncbi:MAG: phosphopyruvate hydratase [Candidatus Berkelbacteria bacterium]